MGLIATIALPRLNNITEQARVARATGDIRTIQNELIAFVAGADTLPDDLAAIGRALLLDPWGRPYQYLKFPSGSIPGAARTDIFSVPLNTTFDLYSVGKDGATATSLGSGASADDVVRGSDGGYIGRGSKF